MTLGSLFDGIGGWPLAAVKYGIEPIWASEIEPFPMAVTNYHFPAMKHLGDIRNINGREIEPVDILCLGFPCQSVSIAGKGEGFLGESGLFYEAVRVMREMREASGKPKFVVVENVTGLFSNHKGATFRAVLEEIAEAKIPMPKGGKWANAGLVEWDRCQIAWRVLDAQFFGVPQRRKRVFLVASFGSQCAGEILFVEESLSGHPTASHTKGQDSSAGTEGGAGNTSGCRLGEKPIVYAFDSLGSNSMKSANPNSGCHVTNIAKTLDTTNPDPSKHQGGIAIYDISHRNDVIRQQTDGKIPCMAARYGTGGNNVPVIHVNIRTFSDKASTLRAEAGAPKHLSDVKGRLVYSIQGSLIGRKEENGPMGNGINEGISFTLNTVDRHAVCVPHLASGNDAVGCLMANCATKQWLGNQEAFSGDYHIICDKTIRKLTPTECERLQGLPDGYTNVPVKGKPPSDAVRYKALGNGMA